MDEFRQKLDTMILQIMKRETNMSDDIFKMLECFIANGCPLFGVIKSVCDFGEYQKNKEIDTDMLKELLKDIPVKWEDEK